MNLYRKKLLDCYYLMLTTQLAFARIAFDIALLDELKDVAVYKYDRDIEFDREILKTMKDPVILKIDQFLDDTDIYLRQLEEDNQFFDDELDACEDLLLPGTLQEFDRTMFLKMLVVHFRKEADDKFTKYIDELCEMSNEIPLEDYGDTDNCDDANIKAVAGFYTECYALVYYLYHSDFSA